MVIGIGTARMIERAWVPERDCAVGTWAESPKRLANPLMPLYTTVPYE